MFSRQFQHSLQRSDKLRLLSYNLQVGIESQSYKDYLTQSWRHLLPDRQRQANIDDVARQISEFDVVALQEVDGGSIRTRFVNQVDYLADRAGFPFWYQQRNRKIGQLAAHSNGLLSKFPAQCVVHHRLPGRIPGRGVIEARFGNGEDSLVVLSMHLALSQIARFKQLSYVAGLVKDYRYFVLMGDMNCPRAQVADEFYRLGLRIKMHHLSLPTFPRWKPRFQFDQIWVSEQLKVDSVEVASFGVSDHLPISMQISLPEPLRQSIMSAPLHSAHSHNPGDVDAYRQAG